MTQSECRDLAFDRLASVLFDLSGAIAASASEKELLEGICLALRRVIRFDRAGLSIFDSERNQFQLLAVEGEFSPTLQVGDYVSLNAIQTDALWQLPHPVLRHDMQREILYDFERALQATGLRSAITVPLTYNGDVVGGLGIASFQSSAYDEGDLELMCRIGSHAALALSNLLALKQMQQTRKREARLAEHRRVLLELNSAVANQRSVGAVLRSCMDIIQTVLPYEKLGIALADESGRELYFYALDGTSSEHFQVRHQIDINDSCFGEAFRTHQRVLRRDLTKEAKYGTDRFLLSENMRAYCTVPLMVQGRCIGGFSLVSKTVERYSAEDADFLQEIANQLALTFQNVLAYEQIENLKKRLQLENTYLQEEIRQEHNFREIVGNSRALLQTLDSIERVARADSTVIILGESGTGKELIARAIHDRSDRRTRPLVKVNCGAISAGLVESELFGHVRGAFTGAMANRDGRFKVADGGSIFLDEVGELPLETQVKLLRVLQEREFEPVGSNRTMKTDVRVIAATNRDLQEAVREGKFRADLYFRLNVFPITVPSLRDRKEDVPLLASFFLDRYSRQMGRSGASFSQEAMASLVAYDWPGNIRELQNVIERALILARGNVITAEGLERPVVPSPTAATNSQPAPTTNALALDEANRSHILSVLDKTAWVIEGNRGAASVLNVHPNTLRSRMKKLGIVRPGS